MIELEIIEQPATEMEVTTEIIDLSEEERAELERQSAEAYQRGEADGYTNGYEIGAKEGAEVGYTKGEQEGYTKGYDKGTHDGEQNALGEFNNNLQGTGIEPAESVEQINEKFEEATQQQYDSGIEIGRAEGKSEAIESLPAGYIKVDPTWTDFTSLCQGRRYSLGENLKYSDTANGTNFTNMFYGWDYTPDGRMLVVPSLDLRKGTNFSGMFNWSAKIGEIGEMNISNATNVSSMFNYCFGLERISFVPECIKVSISFAQSNLLNDASIQSIIDGLADLTGKTAQTLTLHATVGGKLTQAQKDAASAKNWTLAY
jgi:hypothetical protein